MKRHSLLIAVIATITTAWLSPLDATAQVQVGRQATVGNLIAALNNINVEIDELNALNDLTVQDVQVVNVENVLNDANIKAFNNALNRNNVEILNLRNVLNNNQCSVVAVCDAIKNVLNNNNIAIGDVVAIDVLSGGEVVVFVQG